MVLIAALTGNYLADKEIVGYEVVYARGQGAKDQHPNTAFLQ